MSRAATLGNGNILVGIDFKGQVRDFYAPFVGHSNHISGASGNHVHRIGVFVDGTISWLDDPSWQISVGCGSDSAVSCMHAVNDSIGITLSSTDVVHNEENVFLRAFSLGNERKETREIKVFFSQQFRISESRRGDTGFYDPRVGAIIHYKGAHTFLVNAFHEGMQFKDFNIGLFGIENREGTYYDANDGILERNPIEHGSVDSIIGVTCEMMPQSHTIINYWVAYGSNIDEVHELNTHILNESPEVLIRSTENYWKAWVDKEHRDLTLLNPKMRALYKRSLTTIRVHTDNRGGIIASSDTDMLHHGRDTYSYVWPRDAAIIAHSLDKTGYTDVSKRFFQFIAQRVEKGGYLMHKYRADGVLGSSWHPWVQDGKYMLPIQEDETAITLYMLYHHYTDAHDLEFIEELYNPFIEPAGEFLCEFVNAELGLPDSSYDLWEEKYGISTYTTSSVYGALLACSQFANMLGKLDAARKYSAIAQRMKQSMFDHLYDEERGTWVKQLHINPAGDVTVDATPDVSSFFGPIYFGVVECDDERVKRALEVVERELRVHSQTTGYIRYVGDNYYTMQEAGSANPWVITTLWMARYYIMSATKLSDLKKPFEMLEWTCSHATVGGMLAEQMHPHTGEHLSTSPLVWSHAEFVLASNEYIEKHKELSS